MLNRGQNSCFCRGCDDQEGAWRSRLRSWQCFPSVWRVGTWLYIKMNQVICWMCTLCQISCKSLLQYQVIVLLLLTLRLECLFFFVWCRKFYLLILYVWREIKFIHKICTIYLATMTSQILVIINIINVRLFRPSLIEEKGTYISFRISYGSHKNKWWLQEKLDFCDCFLNPNPP